MPSTLLGFFSGGVNLVSGNPYSGRPSSITGMRFKNGNSSSGPVYVAYSGGVTLNSGGSFASGGLMDGFEVGPSQTHNLALPGANGPTAIFATIAPAVSGFVRVFWEVNF